MAEVLSLSGYSQTKAVMAQRYLMGKDRWVYLISLPLQLVPTHLPIPNPDEPFPGNRRVNRRHAEGFGQYWRDHQGAWATPPLMLDTLYPLKEGFEGKLTVAGVEFGVLHLPHNSAAELEILDGQHRILGWKIASDEIAADLKRARADLANSRDVENHEGVQVFEAKVEKLQREQERLAEEYVTLTVLEGVTPEQHRQVFADIANNAKGITKSVTVTFDQRGVINRAVVDVAENHDLFAGRIEGEKDRVLGANPNLLSARNVSDVIRHLMVGIDGRMTRSRESTFKESAILDITDRFLSALVETFPPLQQLMDEEISPLDLREETLLGSPTMWRILAGVYHNLAVDISDERAAHVTSAGDARARELFKQLEPAMGSQVDPRWFDTGFFPRDAKTPSSRAQDLKGMTALITAWGELGQAFGE